MQWLWSSKKIKSDTVSTVSPSISHEVMGPDAMILVFWMLSFKPTFSHYPFTFIKRFFSSSSLSYIKVVSSPYLSLLIFLPAILSSACASFSQYQLNKIYYICCKFVSKERNLLWRNFEKRKCKWEEFLSRPLEIHVLWSLQIIYNLKVKTVLK